MRIRPSLIVVALSLLTISVVQAQNLALLGALGGLGVSPVQAIGGTKALMGIAQKNLSGDEYSQLLSGAPELGQVLQMTGDSSGAGAALGGLMGGGASSSTGSEAAAPAPAAIAGLDALTGNADLVKQFTDLGMDASMIARFVPTLLDAVGGAGGAGTLGLLKKGLGLL